MAGRPILCVGDGAIRYGGHLQDETGQLVTFNSPETVEAMATFMRMAATFAKSAGSQDQAVDDIVGVFRHYASLAQAEAGRVSQRGRSHVRDRPT